MQFSSRISIKKFFLAQIENRNNGFDAEFNSESNPLFRFLISGTFKISIVFSGINSGSWLLIVQFQGALSRTVVPDRLRANGTCTYVERVRFERQSVFVFVYTVVRTLVYRVHSWSIVNLERHLLIDRTFVKFDFCTVATLLNLNRTLHGSI